MKENQIPKRNEDIVTRVIDGETILLPIYRTSNEINCIYTLNQAASRVWQLCDGKKTVAEMKKELKEEFEATTGEIDQKMQELFKDFKEIKAIK
ncbi:MAG: PqqD family protein [Candidatus Omnitrophica bacterium]|nr:PqqD family protein [Candidatus Omnitrophota bacterium]